MPVYGSPLYINHTHCSFEKSIRARIRPIDYHEKQRLLWLASVHNGLLCCVFCVYRMAWRCYCRQLHVIIRWEEDYPEILHIKLLWIFPSLLLLPNHRSEFLLQNKGWMQGRLPHMQPYMFACAISLCNEVGSTITWCYMKKICVVE